MSNLEKIQRYIDITNVKNGINYCMYLSDIRALYDLIEAGKTFEAIGIAFEYGRAKGYRLARANIQSK